MAYQPNSYTSTYAIDSDDASSSSSPSPTLHNAPAPLHDAVNAYADAETEDVFRAVVKCRKSWKTLKGGKVVWPLHLEAALLQGLALYQPDDSRETRLLGRFPMRNRFIAEYILRTTGEKRTPKQVGSRLQQLRDTCGGGRKLQKLLSPCLKPGAPASNRSHYSLRRYGLRTSLNDSGSTSLPGSPVSANAELGSGCHVQSSPSLMYIDIVADDNSTPVTRRESSAKGSDTNSSEATAIGVSSEARPIRLIKPCLAFISRHLGPSVNAHSEFTLYHRSSESVYRDQSPLTAADASSVPAGCAALYTCDLAPSYWQMICDSPDPTEFTIEHNIVRDLPSFDMSSAMFSATYKFRYTPSPLTPVSSGAQHPCADEALEFNVMGSFDNGNTSGMSGDYDSKAWQDCIGELSITDPRGYTSLPSSPGYWMTDNYRSQSIDGHSSSSSSPVTPSFPQHSHYYSL